MASSKGQASISEIQTYSVGATARLTGLPPDTLRAWERRYGAVVPLRTPGGTRRYRESDVERLRLMKAAVDAGHRISKVANLEAEELARLVEAQQTEHGDALEEALHALMDLDANEAERILGQQLAALGPTAFARRFALPLLERVGDGWASGQVCVASEHLGSGILRSLLGGCLRGTAASRQAPPVVFATLPGESHEMGLLVAAISTLGAGANPIYLGPNLPVSEMVNAVEARSAAALALSVVVGDATEAATQIAAAREALDPKVELWVGGPLVERVDLAAGCARIDDLDSLERRVALLLVRGGVG